ncbi:CU044_5270 family protein [Streptomyces sp. NPDC005840]|uniref:CU044_5270 family protein n=2 Tax=Streptomyces TaxID=1883 RepID=A0ABD5EHN8_9ACTN|nr:CU044_5270 family protein [Streptomyces sp. DSM 41981]MDT0433803.1 CU044_5270 family protein [Streptomyces sp. DSM 41981]
MADELDLLRQADPVPAGDPRRADGRPLDRRAELHLERLLSGAADGPARAPVKPTTRPSPWWRGPVGARLVWGVAAAAVVLATALTLLVGGPSAAPAVAAPLPLVVHADTAPVGLAELAARAGTAAADGTGPALRRGTHVQSWSLGMSDDRPPVTLPRERVVRWLPDDSRTELEVATDPRHPGRPVLTDEDGTPRPVDDGQVLSRHTFPPSWSDAPPQSPPPHDRAGLRAYLTEAAHRDGPLGTPELLDAVALLLDHWTLGARESAAVAGLLSEARGLRPAGRVTDRLGRAGQAYVYDGTGVRRMLVLSASDGSVLGLETIYTRADPAYGVRAGDVMDYSAWMR